MTLCGISTDSQPVVRSSFIVIAELQFLPHMNRSLLEQPMKVLQRVL